MVRWGWEFSTEPVELLRCIGSSSHSRPSCWPNCRSSSPNFPEPSCILNCPCPSFPISTSLQWSFDTHFEGCRLVRGYMANSKLLALPCCTLFLSAPVAPPSACTMASAATSFAWKLPCMARTLCGADTQLLPRTPYPPPPRPHQQAKVEQGSGEEKASERKKQPS